MDKCNLCFSVFTFYPTIYTLKNLYFFSLKNTKYRILRYTDKVPHNNQKTTTFYPCLFVRLTALFIYKSYNYIQTEENIIMKRLLVSFFSLALIFLFLPLHNFAKAEEVKKEKSIVTNPEPPDSPCSTRVKINR